MRNDKESRLPHYFAVALIVFYFVGMSLMSFYYKIPTGEGILR